MILINRSWLELKPNEDHNGNQEGFEEYYPRIGLKSDFHHIPKEVFEQWIHPHHCNDETLLNYSWIDLKMFQFKHCEWSLNEILNINVIDSYQDYFNDRASYNDFTQFFCRDIDLNEWQKHGTWRMPPIVLDVNSLKSPIPEWADIKGSYQLVEGHSRLGYLHSVKRISELNKGNVGIKHKIYLMSQVK